MGHRLQDIEGQQQMKNNMDIIVKQTKKKLEVKMSALIVFWVFILLILEVVLSYLNDERKNTIIESICLRSDLFFSLGLIAGTFLIYDYCWKRSWYYLNEIICIMKSSANYCDKTNIVFDNAQNIESYISIAKFNSTMCSRFSYESEEWKHDAVMNLAHDIRTPLTTVVGYLNLLYETPELSDEQRNRYIEIALKKSARINELVSELLDFTRYASKEMSLNKENVNIYYLLSQMSEELFPVLCDNGNSVCMNGNDDITVYVDSGKIARAFGNILKNAAIYSDKGSQINIDVNKDESFASVSISNIGDHISDGDLKAIFDKFKRLNNSNEGTGLGLPIAKEIIELHGGTITALSEGRFLTITVKIPMTYNT